jgi:hypothetical protein
MDEAMGEVVMGRKEERMEVLIRGRVELSGRQRRGA